MTPRSDIARQYTLMQLQTAGHPRVIAMMHAKCVLFMRQAREAWDAPAQRKVMIVRAQNLLAELEAAIKITDDVSKSLFFLYDYCYSLLDLNSAPALDVAIATLSILRDAFTELMKKAPVRR